MIGRTRGETNAQCAHGALLGLLLLPCLLPAFACRLPLGLPSVSHSSASITVSFASSTSAAQPPARTVVPPVDFGITSISVTVRDAHGTVVGSGSVSSISETCTISGVLPGAITVSAVATAAGAAVASGGVSVTVVEGTSASVHVDLLPTTEGAGSFSFTMSWPLSTGAAFVECSLRDSEGNISGAQSGSPAATATKFSWTYASVGVRSGAYDLLIIFRASSGGTPLGTFIESVNIYDNVLSDTWLGPTGTRLIERPFLAAELKDSLTSLSQLTVTGPDVFEIYSPTTAPPLSPETTISMGKITPSALTFTPAIAIDTGQRISYTWNGVGPTEVAPNSPSAELLLADGVTGNTLVIRVTASSGDSSEYTLTAVKAYGVSYDANGATAGDLPADQLCYAGESVATGLQGTLVRTGYLFLGWTVETDPTVVGAGASFVMLSGNTVVHAAWQQLGIAIVNISFDTPTYGAISFSSPDSVAQGDTLTFTTTTTEATDWNWYVDNVLVTDRHEPTFQWDTAGLQPGQYIISVDATYKGHPCTGSIIVTVIYDTAVWIDRSAAGSQPWFSTGSSADGLRLAAGVGRGGDWAAS